MSVYLLLLFEGGIGFDKELQINKQKQKFFSSSDLFTCNNVSVLGF